MTPKHEAPAGPPEAVAAEQPPSGFLDDLLVASPALSDDDLAELLMSKANDLRERAAVREGSR
jgi:hypothetical protein